ncbi:uncharacterized protein LTR77_000303 [Saxophila tyrrhenica]|uniref:UBA domain-containing protein n=1 Tax=Saxophila tyrrhenica TaxID=1690608 RepID=A0AAV9PME3_9PEZI|nr:hypothetical protein LTR77_000303 [Saxophila tyrrhenica]
MAASAAKRGSSNGTAFDDKSPSAYSLSRAASRRTISIFSRRGVESLDPISPLTILESTPSTKPMTPRQKSWLSRRRSAFPIAKNSTDNKATFLKAVPAEVSANTSVDQDAPFWMTNAPVAGEMSTLDRLCSGQMRPKKGLWSTTSLPRAHRTKAEKRTETAVRVGLWVDGVPHWGPDNIPQWEPDNKHKSAYFVGRSAQESEQVETGPARPTSVPSAGMKPKPSLSVIIPGRDAVLEDLRSTAIAMQFPPPRKSADGTASVVSKSGLTPTGTSDDNDEHIVSPIGSETAIETSAPQSDTPATPPQIHAGISTPNRSSSVSSSVSGRDDASAPSNKSSATSNEEIGAEFLSKATEKQPSFKKRTSFRPLPDINKPLPPTPIATPRRSAVARPLPPSHDGSPEVRRSSASLSIVVDRANLRSKSLAQLESLDREFAKTAPHGLGIAVPRSPTLSEAREDLEAHLGHFARSSIYSQETFSLDDIDALQLEPHPAWSTFMRGSSYDSTQRPEQEPVVPKRSRKREWCSPQSSGSSLKTGDLQMPTRRRSETDLTPPPETQGMKKSVWWRQTTMSAPLQTACSYADCVSTPEELIVSAKPSVVFDDGLIVVEGPRVVVDDGLIVVEGPRTIRKEQVHRDDISPASAQDTLLRIMSMLDNVDDLRSTSMINRGMYRVYKDNESRLLTSVLHNQSPAAWEYREWAQPPWYEHDDENVPQAVHTAKPALLRHRSDVAVNESLKQRILKQCRMLVRSEVASILLDESHPEMQHFEDALWRIWSFCNIFGSGKGREDDVTGQLDWLKGGILAHYQDLTATMNVNLDYDMTSVLLNPPEYFAKGNAGGLSAEQLYDIVEIWNCLRTMLQGYHGRTEEAEEYGIFDDVEVTCQDEKEDMLEEWTAHLMTYGPRVILRMAEHAQDNGSGGFALAQKNGWTKWSLSRHDTSRTDFLKEPVCRLYQERVYGMAPKSRTHHEQEAKEQNRRRVAKLAAEIRLTRKTSGYRRLPVIDTHLDRPTSTAMRSSTSLSPLSPRSLFSPVMNRRSTAFARPPPSLSAVVASAAPTPISPIPEERTRPHDRTSQQSFESGEDRALKRIVAMGFPATAAREALLMTDVGDGLRVNRAVEMLLARG